MDIQCNGMPHERPVVSIVERLSLMLDEERNELKVSKKKHASGIKVVLEETHPKQTHDQLHL